MHLTLGRGRVIRERVSRGAHNILRAPCRKNRALPRLLLEKHLLFHAFYQWSVLLVLVLHIIQKLVDLNAALRSTALQKRGRIIHQRLGALALANKLGVMHRFVILGVLCSWRKHATSPNATSLLHLYWPGVSALAHPTRHTGCTYKMTLLFKNAHFLPLRHAIRRILQLIHTCLIDGELI